MNVVFNFGFETIVDPKSVLQVDILGFDMYNRVNVWIYVQMFK